MTPTFSSSKDEPTNADIMAALTALRQEVKGHEHRISRLEAMRELVLSTHETVTAVRADMTKLKQLMDAHDASFSVALRKGVKEIVEKTRAGALADVKQMLESVDCPRCLARGVKGGKTNA